MNELTENNPLMSPVTYGDQTYFTSHYFHKMYREVNGGEKYAELYNFNKLIRSIHTYPDYIERGDIVEVKYGSTDSKLESLLKSNSYRPIMLISATAQIALTHHLDDEISRQVSVGVNSKATKPEVPLLENCSRAFTALHSIALLTGLDNNESCIRANIAVRQDYGVDLLKKLGQTQLVAAKQEILLTPKDIALRMGWKPLEANLRLTEAGLQTSHRDHKERLYYQVTAAGKPYAKLLGTGKRRADGTSVVQIKWFESVLTIWEDDITQ